jgi:hypothetical protein
VCGRSDLWFWSRRSERTDGIEQELVHLSWSARVRLGCLPSRGEPTITEPLTAKKHFVASFWKATYLCSTCAAPTNGRDKRVRMGVCGRSDLWFWSRRSERTEIEQELGSPVLVCKSVCQDSNLFVETKTRCYMHACSTADDHNWRPRQRAVCLAYEA